LDEVLELLRTTGQEHSLVFPYDRVISVYGQNEPNKTYLVGAVGIVRNRIVDIAVVPMCRRLGIGSALVKLSQCTRAYVVDDEARKFWEAIGWKKIGTKLDKGTLVDIYFRKDLYNSHFKRE